MTFQYHLSVRGYELDSYNHLNNAVYLNHFEQARWEFFHQHNLLDQLTSQNLILVVIETNIRYVREANLFDKLLIDTALLKQEPYLIFRQHTINEDSGLLVAKATFKTLFLDKTERTPRDIPESFKPFIPEA
jgi:YbgC/YbaW family acyl-CoA thioester hydrolase